MLTREALAVMSDFSISGERLSRELGAIIACNGKPSTKMNCHAFFKVAGELGLE
jgi:hypothetical protein